MTESFHFDDLEFFTAGTLGPPGERTFFLQGRSRGETVSLKLEKQQVATLADYLEQVLAELPNQDAGQPPHDLTLREPVVPAWTVGAMGVAYDAAAGTVIVIAEPIGSDEVDDTEPPQARFALRREQVTALIDRVRDVVAAGREPCPLCGSPLQPRNGGWCACSN